MSEGPLTLKQLRYLWRQLPSQWGWRRRVRFWLIAWLVRHDTVMIHARLEHVALTDAEIITPMFADAKVFALRNHFTGPSEPSPGVIYSECRTVEDWPAPDAPRNYWNDLMKGWWR